jgi:hypothetical protein
MGPDFIHTILDTTVFLCRQGIQCMRTGTLDPIFHSGSEYQEWYSKCEVLKRDAQFLSNPEPHGIDKFKFLSDLFDSIEKGEAIKKFGVNMTPFEKKTVASLVNDLLFIKATELTKREALKDRKAPFCVLLFGASSVGKSSLKNALFAAYGKTFDKKVEPEFMYTRNPANPFWSGFNSTQWCTVLDDIGFLKPNGGVPDPTLMELIQIHNNVSFVPVQADLADKGKTPFLSELVIATSNTEHLNVASYFSCPLAVSRRLPHVIQVIPRDEYNRNGMLDSSKLPPIQDGEFPDFWKFIVKKVVGVGDENLRRAEFKVIHTFDNIHDLIDWYLEEAALHKDTQERTMSANVSMFSVKMCKRCRKCIQKCMCIPRHCVKCSCSEHECTCDKGLFMDNTGVNLFCDTCIQPLAICECDSKRDQIDIMLEKARAINLQSDITRKFCKFRENIHETWDQTLEKMHGYFCLKCMNKVAHDCIYLKSYVHFTNGDLTIDERDNEIYNEESKFYCLKLWIFSQILYYSEYALIGIMLEFFFGSNWKIRLGWRFFGELRTLRVIFKCMGNRIGNSLCNNPQIASFLFYAATFGTFIAVAIKQYNFWFASPVVIQGNAPSKIVKECVVTNDSGTAPIPLPNERDNVWYRKEEELSTHHISRPSVSYNNNKFEENLNIFSDNCVIFKSHFTENYMTTTRPNRAICLGGQTYMVNNHGLPLRDSFQLDVIQSSSVGVNLNMTMLITQDQIRRFPQNDVAIVVLTSMIPKKNIIKFFPLNPLVGKHNGSYLIRQDDGSVEHRPVKALVRIDDFDTPIGKLPIWKGSVTTDTISGDCGSMLVINSELGPVIVGMHILGSKGMIGCTPVDQKQIAYYLEGGKPIVQSGEPVISSLSAHREFGPLHPKSTVSFIESGVGKIFGSFKGFRPAHKSSVEKSLLNSEYMKLGYTTRYTQPELKGWLPWRKAMVDMVSPVTQIKQSVLDKCVKSFTKDLSEGLSSEDLKLLHILDDFTAMNGAAGVSYIDKMKRNTSMGNPWKTSKRKYIYPIDPRGDNLDPVEFTEEVMERVRDCISKYKDGTQYVPIFNASLKDEPVTFKKAIAGKTRVFMGAPAEFTFVQRKYLLSFSRLVQNNRILFESGPGTVCQSTEWQEIYDHMVQFGDSNLFAGDYAKFDKNMPGCILLAAGEVMYNLCKLAGYTSEDLLVVQGIIYDISFPTVDFNGELIQFAGSNPSGHALTVIINGIANSLYMRYCYCELGNGSCDDFKKFVALFTYGDDNMLGVSDTHKWFNHTSVQGVLANVGITYTMADKEAPSIPFIHVNEVSFLKRRFRLDEDIGAIVAPLEHDSIEKMLMIYVRSKSETPEFQSVNAMGTALREYFWYGKLTFRLKRKMFIKLIHDNGLEPYADASMLPTWEDLYKSFWDASE